MRHLWVWVLAALPAGALAVVGCSEGGGDGGSGGSATTPTGTPTGTGGGTTQTGTTTGSGGNQGGGGGSGGGGEGGGCTEISSSDFGYLGWNFGWFYGGPPTPTLGGGDEDLLELQIYDDEISGTIDLGSADNLDYATCLHCVVVYEDLPGDDVAARTYFQTGGTLELGTTTPYYISGTLTDVDLVEVTIDESFTATPVPDGGCLHITSQSFDIEPPVAGWECDPHYYQDGADCDCDCGVVDPDCSDPLAPVFRCDDPGETGVCLPDGTCQTT